MLKANYLAVDHVFMLSDEKFDTYVVGIGTRVT